MMAKLLLILARRALLPVQCHSPVPLTADAIAAATAAGIDATGIDATGIDAAFTLAFALADVSIAVTRMRIQ